MHDLTKNEEQILLSIWRLKDNAYGITIRKNIMELTNRKFHYGALYNMLYQLVKKGFIESKNSDPSSIKGGRSKVLYSLTADGKKALSHAQEIQKLTWEGIPDLKLMMEK